MKPELGLCLFVLSVAGATMACSNSTTSSTEPSGGGEATIITASAAPREELGVVLWGVDTTSDSGGFTGAIHGYDASNARVVDLRIAAQMTDKQHGQFGVDVNDAASGEHAIAHVAVSEDGSGVIAVSYAPGSNLDQMPKASRAASLAAIDLKSYSPPAGGQNLATSKGYVALGAQTLLEPKGNPFCLIKNLPSLIINNYGDVAKAFSDPKNCKQLDCGDFDVVLGYSNPSCSQKLDGSYNKEDCSAWWGDALHRVGENYAEVAECK